MAGKGKGAQLAPIIRSIFPDMETVHIHHTTYAGHAVILTQQIILEKSDVIVACGGDGTINEIAHLLVNTSIALGIIPIGSGNGFAAHLNIPKDPYKALLLLKKQHTKAVDVGQINQAYFFSNMGLGIDACVIQRYETQKKRTLTGYIKAGLWGIKHYQPPIYTVSWEGTSLKKNFFFLFCSNSNEAGYGLSFTPKAKINDGLLDVLCVESITFIQQLTFSFFVLIRGLESYKKAILNKVAALEITSSNSSFELQIDGEHKIIEGNTLKVRVLKEALLVITPHHG